jgi:hypothetical protein
MPADATPCTLQPAPTALRIGLKGKAGATILARRGLTIPAEPNSWQACRFESADDGRLLRLGFGEYLLERDAGVAALPDWHGIVIAPDEAGYLLLREDCCVLLQGGDCAALLAQVCNVDFRNLARTPHRVVLTLLAGVAVTVISEAPGSTGAAGYRIWCDPSFAHYLFATLRTVVAAGDGRVLDHHQEYNEAHP